MKTHYTTNGDSVTVYLHADYPKGKASLSIDASCSKTRRNDGREDFVLTVESATAIRDALDAYLADEAEKARPTFAVGDEAIVVRARHLSESHGARVRVLANDEAENLGTRSAPDVHRYRVEALENRGGFIRKGDKLWAAELAPVPAPEFKVGDRVELADNRGGMFDGEPLRVINPEHRSFGETFVRVRRESDGKEGSFYAHNLRALPAPDYAALAAEFKPGDFALVSDTPGFYADPAEPNCNDANRRKLAGRAVNVVGPRGAHVRVFGTSADGEVVTCLVHVAHLTRAKAVPA